MSTASAPASPPNTSAGSNAPTLPPTSNGGDNAPSPSTAPPTSNAPTVRTSRPSPPSPSPEPQPQPSPSPPPPPSPSPPPPPPPPPPPSPSPDPPPPPPPPPPSPSPNPRPTAASPPPPPPPPEPAPSPAPPPPPNPSPNPPPEIPAPPPPQSQPLPPIPPSDPANNPPSREPASSDAPINQQVQQQQQGEVSSSFAASNAAIDGAAAATTTARDSPMPTTTDVSSTLVSPTASFESISGVVSRSAGRTSTAAGAGKFTGTMTAAFNASSTVDFGGAISGSDANGAAGVSIGVVFAIVAGCVAAAALLVTLAVWWIRRDNNKTGGGGIHKQGAISGRKDVSSVVFWSKWNKNEKPEMQQPFLVADGGAAGAGAGAVDENASSTLAVPPLLPIESLKEVEHVVVGNSVLGQIEEEDEDEEDAEEEEEDAGLMEVAPLSATESFASTNPLASQDTSRPLTEQQPQPQVAVASEAITTEVSKKPILLDNIPQPVLAASSTSPKITTLSVAADTPRTRRKLLGFLPRITAPRKQSATEISPSTKVQATTATTTAATTSSAAISRAYQMHRPQPTIHQTPADTAAAAAALPSNLVPPAAYEQFQQDLALQYMYGLTNEQQQQLHQHQQHQYFSQYQMMHQTAPELSGMSQEYINSWWQAFYQQNPVLAQEYYEAALKAQREGRL
ncbi:hypothetical protein HDU77_008866 [Chytriomyces hyalinus]|nr:hypothetical protein HDU77_008866 [Chytriomyces hyalinus]